MLAFGIDATDQIRQAYATCHRDILQAPPERFLEADTRLVPRDDDRALYDR